MRKPSVEVGDKFPTNKSGVAEVVEYKGAFEVYVKFEDYDQTGFVKIVGADQLRKGNCKNPYHKSIHTVGYLGVGDYKSKVNGKNTKEYNIWEGMLSRCYNLNDKHSHRYLCHSSQYVTNGIIFKTSLSGVIINLTLVRKVLNWIKI